MKICKHCKEKIEVDASKCPRCQSHQKWYGDMRLVIFLPFLLLMGLFSYYISTRFERLDFEEYKENIVVKRLSQDTIQVNGKTTINILVEIENKTNKRWENAVFEVRYLSTSGDLLNIERDSDYKFLLKEKSTSITSIKIPLYEEYKEAELDINLSKLSNQRL